MPARHYLEYAMVAALLGLCRIMPERMVFGLFKGMAMLTYALLARRRKITLSNMGIAFPEMTAKEKRRLAKKAYLNIADSLALNNLIMTGRISNARLMGLVERDDWEKTEKAHADAAGKGLLVISGHLGNWELMPQYAALRSSVPIHVIARETTNPLLEKRIVRPIRERFGVNVFYKKNALMRIMKAVNKGEYAGLMIDQKLKAAEGIPVGFFGREAPTTSSPALLQIRFGVTVLSAFMLKTGYRQYRMIVSDPIPWNDNGKPLEEQVLELSRIHQLAIENMIREYPDQWFWMHNRWNLSKADIK